MSVQRYDVQRYDPGLSRMGTPVMVGSAIGSCVHYDDYAALEADHAALKWEIDNRRYSHHPLCNADLAKPIGDGMCICAGLMEKGANPKDEEFWENAFLEQVQCTGKAVIAIEKLEARLAAAEKVIAGYTAIQTMVKALQKELAATPQVVGLETYSLAKHWEDRARNAEMALIAARMTAELLRKDREQDARGSNALEDEVARLQKRLAAAEKVIAGYTSVQAARAEYNKGWRCGPSPTGHCEYNGGDSDHCDHCGQPDERK